MSEQHNWDTIRKCQVKLRDEYGVDDDKLFDALVSEDVFSYLEGKTIKDVEDRIKRFDKIFDKLYTKDPIKFLPIFIASLKEINSGAAAYLQGNPENVKSRLFHQLLS